MKENETGWEEYRKKSKLPEHMKRWAWENPDQFIKLIKQEILVREVQQMLGGTGDVNTTLSDDLSK